MAPKAFSASLADRTIDNANPNLDVTADPLNFEFAHECTPGANLDVRYELGGSVDWDLDNAFTSYSTPQDSGYGGSSTFLPVSPQNERVDIPPIDSMLLSTFEFSFLPDILDFPPYESYTLDSMFESPYLTFRYIDLLHGSPSRMSTIMRRQSPFVPSIRSDAAAMGQNFILQNIKAYPALLLSQLNPSPFIHKAHLASEDVGNESVEAQPRSEHLAVCRSIVQMYQMKTPQTKGFIWRTIDAERQRFAEEVSPSVAQKRVRMLMLDKV